MPVAARSVWIPLVAAIVWSVALLPGALLLPIEDPVNVASQSPGRAGYPWLSLTQANGVGILWIPITALVLVLVASYLVMLGDRRNARVPSGIAKVLAVLILVGAVAGAVTFVLGVFLAPAGVLILVAANNLRVEEGARRAPRPYNGGVGQPRCHSGHLNDPSSRYCSSCGELL